ncbi:GNAT family N-acetyltransferase [Algoriphagus namhaensis]
MDYRTDIKSFAELTTAELYSILRLRAEVFVVEQDCPYQDLDQKDQKCQHVMLYQGDDLIAYSRLVPAGLSYPEVAIGRVITSAAVRGKGYGKILMEISIQACREIFGKGPIRLSAQVYAKDFYGALGFRAEGEEYLEDGIPHVEMVL